MIPILMHRRRSRQLHERIRNRKIGVWALMCFFFFLVGMGQWYNVRYTDFLSSRSLAMLFLFLLDFSKVYMSVC
jgi:amino acid permease